KGRGQAPGSVHDVDIWPAYVDRVMSFVDVSEIRPLKVVIDAANGMAGAMLPPVLERLPVQAVRSFFEPDGSFPNHEPNPLLPENREFIVRTTLAEGADLGIAFDGDADRCFFVDDTGEFVPGDFITALLAEAVLAKEPGAKIIYDVRASWAVPQPVLHHRRAEHAGRGRRAQAPGAEGALRRRGAHLAPGRDLGRRRRLAHERAALEHRAAAPAQPRGTLAGADGAQARRGARADPLVKARELGIGVGSGRPGPLDAITDVAGI